MRSVKIRLGAPNYPGDTMPMTGQVTAARRRAVATVAVAGANQLGDHVTATVEVALSEERSMTTGNRLGGAAAIVGIGATEFSKDSGRSEMSLACESVLAAIADAGLQPSDVDGMVTYSAENNPEIEIARNVGIGALRHFSRVHYGGGAACGTVVHGGDGRRDRASPTWWSATARSTSDRAAGSAPACRTYRARPRPSGRSSPGRRRSAC